MMEKPIAVAPEYAVLDPTLFLISRENAAYLKGQRPAPFLDPMRSSERLRAITFVLLAGLFMTVLIYGAITLLEPGGWAIMVTLFALISFGFTLAYMLYLLLMQRTPPGAGVVLAGEVVQADRTWIPGNQFLIGVRYRFSAPGGVLETAQAQGFADNASDTMAPLPGTPVRVYFMDDGKYHLL